MSPKLQLHQDRSQLLIRSYQDGKLLIGDTQLDRSTIVTSKGYAEWPLNSIDLLSDAHFAAVFEQGFDPELVLLGTGSRLQFPSPEQTRVLVEAQVGLEVMDTAAACRTYNVLVDDGRRVVACLIV